MKLTLLRHAQTEGSLRNLYYGAADKNICVATCDFNELLRYLETECKV